MNATEQARRSDALYYSGNDGINRRWLCDKVASLEASGEQMAKLVQDMLMTINNAQRGFSTHPKTYRDYYSRAKKLGVELP